MSVHEIDLSFAWLESTLSGDTPLQGYVPGGVSRTFAKPKTVPPYMIMSYQSGLDVLKFGGRAYAEMRFEVVVVGPVKGMQALLSAAARIDTLLTVTTQTAVTGGTIMSSFREQPVSEDVLVDGETWNSTGGVYLIRAVSS